MRNFQKFEYIEVGGGKAMSRKRFGTLAALACRVKRSASYVSKRYKEIELNEEHSSVKPTKARLNAGGWVCCSYAMGEGRVWYIKAPFSYTQDQADAAMQEVGLQVVKW